jgi:hypothetical protein
MRAIEKLDERKAARAPGFPIDRQDDLRRRRDAAEVRTQVGFGRGVVEITNEQTDGQSTLSYLGRSRAGKRAGGRRTRWQAGISRKTLPEVPSSCKRELLLRS